MSAVESTALIHFVCPPWQQATGGNRYNRSLARALAREGNAVQRISLRDGVRAINRGEPGIFVVDSLFREEVEGWLIGRRRFPDQQVYFLLHYLPGMQDSGLTVGDRVFLNAMDRVIVTGTASARYVQEQAASTTPVTTLFPGLSVPYRRPVDLDHEPLKALVVANLTEGKGVYNLLSQLNVARGVSLTIVGRHDMSPTYARDCFRLAQRLEGAIDITFIDTLSPTALAELYVRHHVFVSASRFETFGMALQDAFLLGLPILSLDVGEVRRFVQEGKNGFVLPTVRSIATHLDAIGKDALMLRTLVGHARRLRPTVRATWRQLAEAFTETTRAPRV